MATVLPSLVIVLLTAPRASAQDSEDPPAKPSALNQALSSLDESAQGTPLDRALADVGMPDGAGDIASHRVGDANLRLIDISLDLLFAVGGSSERDEPLQALQGGGHDPRKRGFTLQNLELSLQGAVDPYFRADAHIVWFIEPLEGESIVELEEAFLTSQELPFGLEEFGFEIEAGQIMTEFGRKNPRHPHAWDWLDQPVVLSRMFGPDGMRGLGVRVGWLTPLPWFSQVHVGVQNANGETMASFLANDEFFDERAIGGTDFEDRDVRSVTDFAWLARWENAWDLCEETTVIAGISGLAGPNATGSDACTLIGGADLFVRWRPVQSDNGWPFVSWQTELIGREYEVDDRAAALAGETLGDWGLYTEVLWGFVRDWAVGVRYEFARGDGPSVGGRAMDPFRDNRQRISPLLMWTPSHFSRIRLQYSFDAAQHLPDDSAHTVWLGFEVLLGKHPAHTM